LHWSDSGRGGGRAKSDANPRGRFLGDAENDLLLRQVRKKLRRDFGFERSDAGADALWRCRVVVGRATGV